MSFDKTNTAGEKFHWNRRNNDPNDPWFGRTNKQGKIVGAHTNVKIDPATHNLSFDTLIAGGTRGNPNLNHEVRKAVNETSVAQSTPTAAQPADKPANKPPQRLSSTASQPTDKAATSPDATPKPTTTSAVATTPKEPTLVRLR